MFCRPRDSIQSGSSLKALGNVAGVGCGIDGRLLLAVKSLCSSSDVCVRVRGINHDCLLLVLDSDKGCHHFSSVYIRGSLTMACGLHPAHQIPFFSIATFQTVDSSATALTAAFHINSFAHWYIYRTYQIRKEYFQSAWYINSSLGILWTIWCIFGILLLEVSVEILIHFIWLITKWKQRTR